VRATGTLRLPEAFDTGEGRSFDYPKYLAKDGIGYQLAFAQIEATGENRGNPVKAAAISVKQAYLRGLGAVLSEPESGLAGGITVGDKRSIGSELSADFQKVSLIHMVVLSGYNITVVINAAARLLAWAPRHVQFGGSGLIVVFFVLMSGGAASATRAGAMALIAMYARVSGRMFIALRALAVVAVAMVAWNPLTLAFDPSFQLSALATFGLILFTPHVAARLKWLTERFGIREIVSSTLGTQLAVLPLLLYQNGNLSIVSLPANLLALLPVPFAMLASFMAAIGGMVFGSLAVPLALPAYMLLAYIIKVAQFFAALPFASVAVPAFSAWWMFASYALLFVGLRVLEKRKSRAQGPAT
jgi:competence protein ComEC